MSPRPKKRIRSFSEDLVGLLDSQVVWCYGCRGLQEHRELWHKALKPSYAFRNDWELECLSCGTVREPLGREFV